MNEHEALQELVRFIGVTTYGKERWFKQNGCWYDRLFGDYIQNEVLLERVVKEIEDEVRCDSADRPTGEWQGYNADNPDWTRKDGTPIFMVCDQCHGTVLNTGSAHWHYCPNCGAKMGGDSDG